MNNPGGDPLHQGGAQMAASSGSANTIVSYSSEFTTPCVPDTVCELSCDFGYVNGPSNACQYCLCATRESKYTILENLFFYIPNTTGNWLGNLKV